MHEARQAEQVVLIRNNCLDVKVGSLSIVLGHLLVEVAACLSFAV